MQPVKKDFRRTSLVLFLLRWQLKEFRKTHFM